MVRRLAHAAILCVAGAGLAVYGATRVWSVRVTPRPGLSDVRDAATGADAQPWLIALALIALAGTGALLATRGVVRRLLGGLIALTGLGVAVAAVAGRLGTDPGDAGAGGTVWPIACVLGGALVVLAGVGAARRGHEWPAMGSRYERHPVPSSRTGTAAGSGPSPAAGRSGEPGTPGAGPGAAAAGPRDGSGTQRDDGDPVDTRAVWDALDRGDDPTAR